jgi:hypothetical protein
MLKRLLAVAAALPAALGIAGASPLSQWIGTWENRSADIVSVTVAESGGALTVSVQGKCTPNPCEWGSAPATAYSGSAGVQPASDAEAIVASFSQGFANRVVVLDGQAGNNLRVHVYTDFIDGSGRADYVQRASLTRRRLVIDPRVIAPGAGVVLPGVAGPGVVRPAKTFTEDCISFNPAAISVANPTGSSWKVVQGSMWMLDAGPNRAEMETAKAIIQRYGMNRQCFVGRPGPSLEYWLIDDNAPSGSYPGEDCVSINPSSLFVQPNGGAFTVVSEGNHWAFSAPTQAEAEQIIAVVRYYGFTQSCYVGRPGPSMSYLRK